VGATVSVQRRVRGDRTRYEVRWREEDRHRARVFDRKADAEAFDREARRRAQMGAFTPAEPSRERFGEWLRRWWDREAGTWAASTRRHRGYVIDKWIAPYLSGVRLADLGPGRVREWRSGAMADGCSAHQANQALRILSACLGAAVVDGRLPSNPCAGLRKVPHTVARPRALAPIEVERIRAAMPTLRDVVLVGLLAYAGLRPEEALALRWGDVGRTLVIDRAYTHGEHKGTKTHQRRSVEVLPPLADDLARLGELVPAAPDHLVAPALGRADRRPRDADPSTAFLDLGNWRSRTWAKACALAVVTATPYDGRHTYASLLIHEGRSPLLVAAALGHSSAELVWRRYAHVFDEARLAPNVPMVEAIEAARASVDLSGVRPMYAGGPERDLPAAPPEAEN
jgi:integrase